jgi:hypothetical protein
MSWTVKLAVSHTEARLLVQDEGRGDVLKARLPARPRHPRALLTLLEGLALWSGSALCVVISADESVQVGCALDLFGSELWPVDSPLVRFEPAVPASRRRLSGLGDFRALRRGKSAAHRSDP